MSPSLCVHVCIGDSLPKRTLPVNESAKISGPGEGHSGSNDLPPSLVLRARTDYPACGVAAAVVPTLVAGAVGLLAAVVPTLVAGAVGLLGGVTVGAEAVIGVTRTPVTSPLIAFFCFVPNVCRAARVEARFAAAAALTSTVSGARDFGWIPKSASTSGEDPKAPFTYDSNALMKARRAGI
jgi:hypothetical protein